jgi:hypothetical protein
VTFADAQQSLELRAGGDRIIVTPPEIRTQAALAPGVEFAP